VPFWGLDERVRVNFFSLVLGGRVIGLMTTTTMNDDGGDDKNNNNNKLTILL
jgi:hypothetical protein